MNTLSFNILSKRDFDKTLWEDEEKIKDTILEKYNTIIFDLDKTLWDCFTSKGEQIAGYQTTPPYSLQSKNVIVDIKGNIVQLQEGVRELLELLDNLDKNLGIVSRGQKLIDVNKRIETPFTSQPSVMLLKMFDLYKYFNKGVILKAFEDKKFYVKEEGKTLFIDDDDRWIQSVNEREDIDVLNRKSFKNWEDLLRKNTFSSQTLSWKEPPFGLYSVWYNAKENTWRKYYVITGYGEEDTVFCIWSDSLEDLVEHFYFRDWHETIVTKDFFDNLLYKGTISNIRKKLENNTEKLSWKEKKEWQEYVVDVFKELNIPLSKKDYFYIAIALHDNSGYLSKLLKEGTHDAIKSLIKDWYDNKRLSFKQASPESYTDKSDIDSEFRNLNDWHWEDKNLPFLKDEFPGEDTHYYKKNTNVFQELDEEQGYAYNGVQASQKLSWQFASDAYYELEDILRKENYSFHKEGDNIVIDEKGFLDLFELTQLPENTVFNNKGSVALSSLTQLPNNTVFNNKGDVYLFNLTQLPNDIIFNNKGFVNLGNVTQLPDNKEQIFKNDGIVVYDDDTEVYDPRTGKFSSLPNAEDITEYDISPLNEMNLYPSKRKDNYNYKVRNTKGEEEMIFEKGLHQTIDRPETNRDIVPYGSKLSWKSDIQEVVNDEEWQELRKSLVNTWKKTPEENIKKLRGYLGNMEDPLKLRRVHNYLTGSGFRIGVISHPEINKLLEEVREKRKANKKLSWKIMSDEYYDFEELLRKENIHFKTKDGVITIDHEGDVYLDSLTQLPDNVIFNNNGYVFLRSLTQLPDNVIFNNNGYVNLHSLTQLPDNVIFNNKGDVYLNSLTQLPDNVYFNNKGHVNLRSLTQLPDNKEQIFKNDGIVYYNRRSQKYDPRTRKLSWKEPTTIHQDLMNEAYEIWQKNNWDDKEFIEKLEGTIHKYAVILGNLNYQVENGGWDQWWSNGLGPRDWQFLLALLPQINTPSALQVLKILKKAVTILKKLYRNRRYEGEALFNQLDILDDAYYEINEQFMEDVDKFLLNAPGYRHLVISNQTYDVVDSQLREPEDMNFVTPYEDTELKRNNPPRYDKRKDIYQNVNENLRDSDVSNRFDQTNLTSGANKKLSFNKTSVDINEWLSTGIPFAYKRDSKKLYVGKRGQSHGEMGKELYDHGLKFTLNTNSYSYYPSDEEFLLGRVNSTKTKVGFYAKEDDSQIYDCLFELLQNKLISKDTLVYLDEMFSYDEEGKSVREIFSSRKLSWTEIDNLGGWIIKAVGKVTGRIVYGLVIGENKQVNILTGWFSTMYPDDPEFTEALVIKDAINKFKEGHATDVIDINLYNIIPMRKVIDLDKISNKKLSWQFASDAYYELEDVLREENYSFHKEGDNIVIDEKGFLDLFELTQLPENTVFNNKGSVDLSSLTQLPNNTVFNNKGDVYLFNLTQLPNDIIFNNKGFVNLGNLTQLPDNKEQIFKNDGIVIYDDERKVYDPRTTKLSWKLSPREKQNPLYGRNVKKWTTKYLGINKIAVSFDQWLYGKSKNLNAFLKEYKKCLTEVDPNTYIEVMDGGVNSIQIYVETHGDQDWSIYESLLKKYSLKDTLEEKNMDYSFKTPITLRREDIDSFNKKKRTNYSSKKLKLGELNPPPGFIPTNKGMMTEEDIMDDLSYSSYAANRDYDRYIEPYSTISNPDYDFEKSRVKWRNFWMKAGGWKEDKLNRFERRYFIETGGK